MRSKESLLLEFEQLLNLIFQPQNNRPPMWKEPGFESALQAFSRDSAAVIPRAELHSYARQQWLAKCGLDRRGDIALSLSEMLCSELPLRS